MTYGSYLLRLIRFSLAANVALGFVLGVAFLVYGDTTANVDVTLEIGRFDGLWFIVLLPVLATPVLVLVSPVAFVIDRWLPARAAKPGPREDD